MGNECACVADVTCTAHRLAAADLAHGEVVDVFADAWREFRGTGAVALASIVPSPPPPAPAMPRCSKPGHGAIGCVECAEWRGERDANRHGDQAFELGRRAAVAEVRAALAIGEGMAEGWRRRQSDTVSVFSLPSEYSITNVPRDALEASRMIKLVEAKR